MGSQIKNSKFKNKLQISTNINQTAINDNMLVIKHNSLLKVNTNHKINTMKQMNFKIIMLDKNFQTLIISMIHKIV